MILQLALASIAIVLLAATGPTSTWRHSGIGAGRAPRDVFSSPNQLRAWEKGFHEFMAAQFPQVGERIRSEKAISKETEAELRRGIEEFKKSAPAGSEKLTAASL